MAFLLPALSLSVMVIEPGREVQARCGLGSGIGTHLHQQIQPLLFGLERDMRLTGQRMGSNTRRRPLWKRSCESEPCAASFRRLNPASCCAKLEELIASKQSTLRAAPNDPAKAAGRVEGMLDALKRSLEAARRKPAVAEQAPARRRKRAT